MSKEVFPRLAKRSQPRGAEDASDRSADMNQRATALRGCGGEGVEWEIVVPCGLSEDDLRTRIGPR